MNLDRFLTLLATIIGLIGSIFLVRGSLGLTPDIMARLAETIYWFNEAQVTGLAAQKANAVCGAVFILLAFALTVTRLAFVDEQIRCFDSKVMAFAVALAIAAVLCVGLLFIKSGIARSEKQKIGLMIVTRRLDVLITGGRVGLGQVKELGDAAQKIASIDMTGIQDYEGAFRRIVEVVGRKLPDKIDLSELRRDGEPIRLGE